MAHRALEGREGQSDLDTEEEVLHQIGGAVEVFGT